MFLNYEEITTRNLIEFAKDEEFSNASYNLTVNYIIDMDGKNIDDDNYKLKPQGMVYVVFKEVIKMQDNLIAFAHVKTSLTKRGVMATNIGIVDPTYTGLISTLLINFGKSDFIILKEDPGLRISFAEIKAPKQIKTVAGNNLGEDLYVKNIQKDISNLDEKFLNLNSVEREVRESVIGSIVRFVGIFTIGAFLVTVYFQSKNSSEKDLERSIKKYETELSILEAKNDLLSEKLAADELKLKEKDIQFQKELSKYDAKLKELKESTEKDLKSLSKRLSNRN